MAIFSFSKVSPFPHAQHGFDFATASNTVCADHLITDDTCFLSLPASFPVGRHAGEAQHHEHADHHPRGIETFQSWIFQKPCTRGLCGSRSVSVKA